MTQTQTQLVLPVEFTVASPLVARVQRRGGGREGGSKVDRATIIRPIGSSLFPLLLQPLPVFCSDCCMHTADEHVEQRRPESG